MDELDALRHGQAGHTVSTEVAERVRAVLSAAEAAASAVRHEAEQEAQARRRATDEEARVYLEEARRDADAFLRERQRRISDLSDAILERSEQLLARLDRADDVRRQLQDLIDALGTTAAQLAADAGGRPRAAEPAPPPRVAEPVIAEPAPEPEPELEPESVVEEAEVELVEEVEPDVVELPRKDVAPPPRRDRDAPDDDDDLAARLVALQMAVAGANRGEVSSHLDDAFRLRDPDRILDDVFGPGTEADKRVSWPEAVRDVGR